MAINMNFNNLQLNTIAPQRESHITTMSEQRIVVQNINRIDKKIESIDKEIDARKQYIVLLKESREIDRDNKYS